MSQKMENFNNIDQLFNEESKKAEENTDFPRFENVWEKVESRLNQVENKKKMIPIWLPYSIAASLAITIGLVYFMNQNNELTNTSIASNNTIEKSINQNVNNILDSSKIAIIEKTIQHNIQKTELNNIENSTAQNISAKVISDVESVKPSLVQNAEILEPNLDKANKDLASIINDEILEKEDSIAVLASGFVQKEEVVKTYAMKEARTEKSSRKAISNENHVILAESTNVGGFSDDEDFDDVKIATNKNSQPLYIIDGYIADTKFLKNYNVKKITSLNIVEGKNAVQLYGNSGKKGVVVITTKGLTNKEKKELESNKENTNSKTGIN